MPFEANCGKSSVGEVLEANAVTRTISGNRCMLLQVVAKMTLVKGINGSKLGGMAGGVRRGNEAN